MFCKLTGLNSEDCFMINAMAKKSIGIRRPLQRSSVLDLLDRPSGLKETACRPDGCSLQAVGLKVFNYRDPGYCP